MVIRSILPPIILIGLVIESILGGLATQTEAAGVGALGAIVLGFINLVLLPSLGGDELVVGTVDALGLGSWGLLQLAGLVLVATFPEIAL